MRVVVAGAGGLGSKFGGMLSEHAEVWLLHHRPEHVRAVREHGLRIVRNGAERVVYPRATTDPVEPGSADLVIILVKSYDTDTAARQIVPLLREGSLVVTFQNGLGSVERIAAHAGEGRSILGVTFHGATLLAPGHVLDAGHGPTYLGAHRGAEERLRAVAALFTRAGVPTEVVADVAALLWAKLAVTAGINAVATVLRVPNGALGQVAEARRVSLRAIEETMAVAAAKGITLAFDPRERFEAVTTATGQMRSGTLLDALRGRRTEVDAIAGAIAERGHALGVPTPVNETLWMLVKAIEMTHEYRVESAF